MTGVTSATPLIDKAWNRSRPANSEEPSKLLVSAGVIQKSACAWSIIIVIMRSKLRKTPS